MKIAVQVFLSYWFGVQSMFSIRLEVPVYAVTMWAMAPLLISDIDNSGIMLRSELHDALTLLGITPSDKELDEYLLVADVDDLLGAFHDIPVVVFRTKMQRILENAHAHISDSNQHEVSCYVDDILSALDPNNTECIDVQERIRILSTPYHSKPSLPSSKAGQQQGEKLFTDHEKQDEQKSEQTKQEKQD
ncbi:hypothetical protein BBO99_00009098 [Phytophthora kernoviae]|uniref:Calmodulin n=1 Tax=Phytophthora kernoviae TaxID=325452 RepID=A0A421GDC4_9STRA|nr:hypothetical protein JM16_009751 [Phytophthora kernoviae]RLN21237.1 hypothetical protein BBI17_009184 [Phytophthora kernoviae]RLN74101.1 hypothetical protein BBO99_00009098 [Phytophthora kernoviae]